MALALGLSAWLVGTAQGALATGLTFVWLFGLHLGYLVLKGERPGQAARSSRTPPAEVRGGAGQLASLEAACASAQAESRAKNDFLASMSHELRTQLAGLVGMAEFLLETELNPEQRDYGRTIDASAKALIAVLKDIQDFSRIESGQLELSESEFSLRHCVENVVDLYFSRAYERGVELVSIVRPDVPDSLLGDSDRIRQVLGHLVANAVQFTEQGWIKVEVDTYELGAGAPEAPDVSQAEGERLGIELRVADTGVGQPGERAPLLHPLTSRELADAPRPEGTGLGLALTHQLAHLMGGELTVESRAQGGSSLRFRVPLGVVPREQIPTGLEDLAGKKALVVDASQAAREAAAIYLSSWGLDVIQTASAAEALQALDRSLASQEPFELVLLDRFPSDLDGKELGARIKNELGLSGVRLVLTTPPGRTGKTTSLVRAGFDAWISKPVSARKLREALQHVITDHGSGLDAVELPRAALPSSPSSKVSVLLVEDNLVNRKVTALCLRRLGYEVEAVADGKSALEALRHKAFALVLMDCRMPVMDGFQATASLRKMPNGDLPVVALTTAVSSRDRQRCLDAGMNDYLSKPVQKAELEKMLEKWILSPSLPAAARPETNIMNQDRSVLDPEVISSLRELGGEDDPGLFDELVQLFLEDTPARLQELHGALRDGDPLALERAAHALKSSAANLGALSLSALLREIEHAGRARDLERAATLVETTTQEFERVESALRAEIA